MIDIGVADTVFHRPSRETWIVCRVTDDSIYPAGWPCSRAELSDCLLVNKATPKQYKDMIKSRTELPVSDGRHLKAGQ